MVNQSCVKGGFDLVVGTKKRRKNYTKTTLKCRCHEKARQSKSITKNQIHSDKPQDDTKTCGMYFNIYKDHNCSQYYIRENGGHNLHHTGHPPVRKELKEATKRHLSKSAIDDAQELIRKNMDATIIQEMLQYKHDVKLNKASIKKMRQTVLMEEFSIDGKTQQTTAQILLKWLDDHPELDYVAYYGSYEEAKNSVKVRKVRKKGKRTKVARSSGPDSSTTVKGEDELSSETKSGAESDGVTVGTVDVPAPEKSNALAEDPEICKYYASIVATLSLCNIFSHIISIYRVLLLYIHILKVNDVSQDAKSFVKSLISQLTTGDGTILLAVMWVSEDGKLYHKKFPHVLGCDVTFGTNAEKRPLFRASGKTMDNKNIPHVNAFVPSQQRWVFDWIFEDGLPSILDEAALKKTCIILTDQDHQLVGALLTKLRDNGTYGHAMNRLCKWHKISSKYTNFVCIACQLPLFLPIISSLTIARRSQL
jgi:hypothetical protein